MPLVLYRHMLVELVRVMALTAGVLVTVIAFGAAIKPLANEDLLSAAQTAKYILLAIVPMLQFALPFAAGFAATIVLHRMASDNEILAMAASGLSYRRILAPLLGLGLVLLLVMVLLTQSLIPRFWALMREAVTTDVTRLFEASIDRGVPFEMGDVQIFAQRQLRVDRPGSGANQRLILINATAVELDDDGGVRSHSSAEQAVADIYRRDGRTLIMVALRDATTVDQQSIVGMEEYQLKEPIVVPSAFEDDPAFMSRAKLLELRDDPDRFHEVHDSREKLADSLREAQAWRFLDDEWRAGRGVRLLADDGRAYDVHAGGLQGAALRPAASGSIEVVQLEGERPMTRYRAPEASIAATQRDEKGMPRFELVLEPAESTDLRGRSPQTPRRRIELANLAVPALPNEELRSHGSIELLARADGLESPGPRVTKAARDLRNHLDELRLEIEGRLLERYALSVTAPLLLVLGGVLAIWLRSSQPLSIYLWAFAPAVLDIILISGGEQMIRDGRLAAGAAVLMSGNVALLGVLVFAYVRLARN